MEMTKLCTITTSGSIRELGGINGPITKPVAIKISDIISMVNRGVTIYEHNPSKISQKKRLTRTTIRSNNFPTKTVTKQTSKKKETRQVKTVSEPEPAITVKRDITPVKPSPVTELTVGTGSSGIERITTPDFG